MVIILAKSGATSVSFPKNIEYSGSNLTLYLSSELNNTSFEFPVTDISSGSNIQFVFNLSNSLNEVQEGEYTFKIVGRNRRELSTGLVRIGKLEYSPRKINNKPKKIIEYGA